MQKRIEDNVILMYSSHNEGNSVVAGRFIRTLNGKISKKKITANDINYLVSCLSN